MEVKNVVRNVLRYKIFMLALTALGLVGGIAYSMLPQKYYATGSLYIKRSVEDQQKNFFTYEGYYSQQVAVAYTNTISALAESLEIRSGAMKSLGLPVTEETLRKYGQRIKIKKAGPQLITITVKGETPEAVGNLWNSLSQTIISTSKDINTNGDPHLDVAQITEVPVVKTAYNNLIVFSLIGGLLGTTAAILLISTFVYFKEN